jgi:hypothetical protein
MGAYEEGVRKVLSEICSDELLDDSVEKVLEEHCNVYALWAMSQVMSAQEDAAQASSARDTTKFQIHQGRIAAYQALFEKVAFDGLSVADGTLTVKELTEAIAFWKKRVEDFLRTIIPGIGV